MRTFTLITLILANFAVGCTIYFGDADDDAPGWPDAAFPYPDADLVPWPDASPIDAEDPGVPDAEEPGLPDAAEPGLPDAADCHPDAGY